MTQLLTIIFLCVGSLWFIIATVGILRLPDFYTRLHAAGKCDTLGLGCILTGLILYNGINLLSAKLLLIIIFVFLSNPTAVNAISRSAYKCGIKPFEKN